MNIQSLLPIIFRRQRAELLNDSTISFLIVGHEATIDLKSIRKISIEPVMFNFAGVIPIKVYDLTIIDNKGDRYILLNISEEGFERIENILATNPPVEIEYIEERLGLLFEGLVRFL